MRFVRKSCWFVFFSLMAISCLDEPDCFRLNNNIIGVAFKKMFDGQPDTVAIVGVQTPGIDSIFNSFVLTSAVYMPVNFQAGNTSFIIRDIDGVDHTLNVNFDSRAQYISEECGARYVISNLEVTDHDYDSLRLINDSPFATTGGTNIEVFRCPRTNILEMEFYELNLVEQATPLTLKFESVSSASGGARWVDTTLQKIYLPLNPDADADVFTFTFADSTTQSSMPLTYVRYDEQFFEQCGNQKQFGSLRLGTHTFTDSLVVSNDTIRDPSVTNVKYFKCPTSNTVQVRFRQSATVSTADTARILKVTANYGNNVVLFEGDESFVTIRLPLNPSPAATSTEFTFDLAGGVQRTLLISYAATADKIYTSCSALTIYSNFTLPTGGTTFRSAAIRTGTYPIAANVEVVQ